MNVFVSETCYRQVYGGNRGLSERRIDDFNRLVRRLQEARTREDLQVKGLGTKKYRSLGRDVYGVDLNNGFTAERVIFLFVDPDDAMGPARFGRYAEPGQVETVLLCYCSEHDAQHRNAAHVGKAQARGELGPGACALPHAQLAEFERVERGEVPWRRYSEADLARYGRPRTPVLTEDKFRIVTDALARPGSMLVTGAAGSGKTELGLRVAEDFVRSGSSGRVLYLTASRHLLAEVEGRAAADLRSRCTFMTLDTLLREGAANPRMRFAGAAAFRAFAQTLQARPAMGGRERARMLRLLDERGLGCVYAEVYGVIAGGMGVAWDRLDLQGGRDLLDEDAYLALPDERCGLSGEEDRRAAHAVARAYRRWVQAAGLASRNAAALAMALDQTGAAFELVIADEVQDLSEVQIELLRRLAGEGAEDRGGSTRLFMTGDVNQVLAPTAFDPRRLMRMDGSCRLARLQGNFRNPEAVCRLANAVGELRASSRRLPARRGVEDAPEKPLNRSAGRTLWCVGPSEDALVRMADEAANVALVTDADTYRRLRPLSASIFTVEQIKGMEFENVVLYNLLGSLEGQLDALFEDGPKDASLHRALNTLYVGVTRSCGCLLLAEPRATDALRRLAAFDPSFDRVDDLAAVDFDLDASAFGYYRVGCALKEQGAYAAARAHLERALAAEERLPGSLSARDAEQAQRLIEACRIYEEHDPESCAPAELLGPLEEHGLYEEALPFARAALDPVRSALLALAADRGLDGARFGAADRVAAFEEALARSGLDVAELYGVSPRYDGLLDWYLAERRDDLDLLSLETAESVRRTVSQLSSAVDRLAACLLPIQKGPCP